ncbi:MAG TPA: DnaJ C-terminal domain-containing protein [Caulobacteraceae bacterium]|jgi:curved DNA-binding protein
MTHDAMTADEALDLLGLSGPVSPEAVADAFRARLSGRPDQAVFRRVIEAYALAQRLNKPRAATAANDAGAAVEAPPEVRDTLNISINEALGGVKRRIRLPDGSRAIANLPAGLRTGDVIRLKRSGDQDALLKVRIGVEPHRSVEGHDLKLVVAVDRRVLAHGGRVEIETREGPRTVWIRSTFSEGESLRLRGRGLPARGDYPTGDLVLTPVPLEAEPPAGASAKLSDFKTAWAA